MDLDDKATVSKICYLQSTVSIS